LLPAAIAFLIVGAAGLTALLGWATWKRMHPDAGTADDYTSAGGAPALQRPRTPEELTRLSSPIDSWKLDQTPPVLRALAGGGDPTRLPPEVLAVLGDDHIRHAGLIRALAFSPDGQRLATASADRTAGIWNAATGRLERMLAGHAKAVTDVDFSPDGSRLATSSDDGTVKVWAAGSGSLLQTYVANTGGLLGVSYSRDGRRLLARPAGGGLIVLDAVSASKPPSRIKGDVFSLDGERFFALRGTLKRELTDAVTGERIPSLPGATRYGLNREGTRAVVGGERGEVRVFDLAAGKAVLNLQQGEGQANATFSPDGSYLASWGNDATVTLWDAAGKPVRNLAVPAGGASAVAFSGDGTTLAAAGRQDGIVRVWDVATGKERFPRTGPQGELLAVAVSPDGQTLAAAGTGQTVRLWDLGAGRTVDGTPPVRSLAGHRGMVVALAFSPSGRLLASSSTDKNVILWDVAAGDKVRTLQGSEIRGGPVAFTADGQQLAVGGAEGSLTFFDVNTGKTKAVAPLHTGAIRAVAFSPDGRYYATGGGDKVVYLCEMASGRKVSVFGGANGAITGVAFTPDSRTLAAGSDDGLLRLWDVASGEKTTLDNSGGPVAAVAIRPTGDLIATGSADGTVRLWQRKGGALAWSCGPGPFGRQVNRVAFTPEGRYLATANGNGTVTILRVPTTLAGAGAPK
jgi:WD40 repeat protein